MNSSPPAAKPGRRHRHHDQELPVRDASTATALRAGGRRCLPHSPEYLNKEIGRFWEEIHRQAIRVYNRGTVQPGAAMTVKEMGPAIGARSPALAILGRVSRKERQPKRPDVYSLRLSRDIPARTAGGNDHCLTRTNIGELTTPLGRARGGRVAQCRAPNGRPARPRAGRTSRAKRPGAWPRNRRGSVRTTRTRRCAGRCRG